nr:hypothetical protein [Tanacetum cinerariifolium]
MFGPGSSDRSNKVFDLESLLKWGGYVTPWVEEIVKNLKWLECVRFRRLIVSDKDLEVLAERCGEKLKVLRIEWLECVRFRRLIVSDKDLEVLAERCGEKLKVLRIEVCMGFSTYGLMHFGKRCSGLRILSLERSFIDDIGGEWSHELALRNKCLESLRNEGVSSKYVAEVFRYAVNLGEFGGDPYIDEGEEDIGVKFPPKMRRVMWRKGNILDIHIIRSFGHQLTKLDLRCSRFGSDEHCFLIHKCLNLEELYTNDAIGDFGLQVASHFCKKLRRIKIRRRANLKKLRDFYLGLFRKVEKVRELPLDNGVRALLTGCTKLVKLESNSTLKNHISHPHCEALKRVSESGQSSMSRDGSIFVYIPDVLREQFTGLVIQRGLPFNHFDDEQTTRVFQKYLQPKYNYVIAFKDFPVPHTGSALARTLRKTFAKFNLENKIMSIALDNASNNTSAIDSNSTLKNHISHPHCEALKRFSESGQSSMSRDGSIFVYNPDVLREQFTGLVIQRGLPFNHFDDEQTTRVFQKHLQPKYNHNHLDAQKRKQHKFDLENPIYFEEEILDAEVQQNEVIPLSEEEIALDVASSEGTKFGSGSGGEEAQKPVVPIIRHQVPRSSIDTACGAAYGTINSLKYVLTQSALDALCEKYYIIDVVHPQLPGRNDRIQNSSIAAKVSHFEILCRVHGFDPTVGNFRRVGVLDFHLSFYSFPTVSNLSLLICKDGFVCFRPPCGSDQGDVVAQGVGDDDVNKGNDDAAAADHAEQSGPVIQIRGIDIEDAGASVAGKSLAALQDLIDKSILAVEIGVTAAATIPFLTSFVTPHRSIRVIGSLVVMSTVQDPDVLTMAIATTVITGTFVLLPKGVNEPTCASIFTDYTSTGNVGLDVTISASWAARQTCLGAEVRMRLEHVLRVKKRLEGKCGMQANLLKERDTEIASLKTQLSLKKLRSRMQLVSVVESWILRLWTLPGLVSELEATSFGLCNEVARRIGRATDKGMQAGLKASVDHGRAGRGLDVIAAYDPSTEANLVSAVDALRAVNFPLLAQLESRKDASMVDIMDLLYLEGLAVESLKASRAAYGSHSSVRGSSGYWRDLLVLCFGCSSFSCLKAQKRCMACRLSFTDVMVPLLEPLSVRS